MRVHFIGIGGIGMSALARLMLHEGHAVSGSDITDSPTLAALRELGLAITIGQDLQILPRELDLVVYSAALEVADPDHLAKLKAGSIKVLSYGEMVGHISARYKTVAIAGTHGKTTTTAMVAKVLQAGGLEPTVIIGGVLKEGGSNFVPGRGEYLVVEADEYRRNFLSLSPQVLVITNVALDHLDYYRDLEDIKSAFAALAAKATTVITVVEYSQIPRPIKLPFLGEHNQANAQAAIAAGLAVGVSEEVARAALEDFAGVERRFEYKGETPAGALVYDDYAHNPEKVAAALAAARAHLPDKRLIAVFQPHLYSRTKLLLEPLAASLRGADEVILAPIYAAREMPDGETTSEKLASAVGPKPPTRVLLDLPTIANYLKETTSRGDAILIIGAGDIYHLARHLLQ